MEHNKVLQPQCHFDRICIINTVQALCIFTTSVFALNSCLATKITSFTIFFFCKCAAFHYLPFVNTGWQLHYLYARPDMWMLYITMWGHIHILTFTWEARPLPCRVSPLSTLHVVQCAAKSVLTIYQTVVRGPHYRTNVLTAWPIFNYRKNPIILLQRWFLTLMSASPTGLHQHLLLQRTSSCCSSSSWTGSMQFYVWVFFTFLLNAAGKQVFLIYTKS